MASFLYRIGMFSARRHWIVIGIWLVLIAGLGSLSSALGNKTVSEMSVPSSPANQAFTMLSERFGGINDASAKVIFVAPQGQNITQNGAVIDQAITALEKVEHVSAVQSPFASGNSAAISSDQSMAYASVTFDTAAVDAKTAQALTKATSDAVGTQLTVAYVGIPDPSSAPSITDAVGIVMSFVILIITFGSFLAAGMPPLTALLGVGLSLSVITVLSNIMTLNSTTSALATMLGLAVGIDYALFIISRHRSNLVAGMPVRQSIAVANSTAGSAVVFAGVTVIIALLGLFIVGIPFLGMMGLGAAIGVSIAVSISVTLIPAVLGLCGSRLIPKKTSRAARRETDETRPTWGARWAHIVTAKPLLTVVITVVGLAVLASPLPSMKLTLTDSGYDAPGSVTRVGYDTLAQGWGAGTNGPLLIVADISRTPVEDIETVLGDLSDYFAGVQDVQSVSAAFPNPTLDLALVSITPRSGPSSQSTVDLVSTLRNMEPAFEEKFGFSYQVTGATAMGVDLSHLLANAILPFGIVVIGLSLLLLMIVFRSLAVPISATLGYVLSLCAALGVTVAVFQWGWGADFFSVTKVGPLFCAMPILVMAVLFGLAMDYEVFLVSRIRERFVETGNPRTAVTSGFKKAARVVTAASIIMFCVFISFVPGSVASMQSIALALAVGVALDALVVRMTLIPALMTLLGKWGWALPASWQRVLPIVDIEGEAVHGRLATLEWHSERAHNICIDAQDLEIAQAALPPLSFTINTGERVAVVCPDAHSSRSLVAVLTGRAPATGLLISCGRPLPYDGAHVRRRAACVLQGIPSTEGSVAQLVRQQLRFNAVRSPQRSQGELRELATELSALTSISLGSWGPQRAATDMSSAELWVLDICVAVMSKAELICIEAFSCDADQLQGLAQFLSAHCAESTSAVLTVQGSSAQDDSAQLRMIRVSQQVAQ